MSMLRTGHKPSDWRDEDLHVVEQARVTTGEAVGLPW